MTEGFKGKSHYFEFGHWKPKHQWTEQTTLELLSEARKKQTLMARHPISQIFELLDGMREKWSQKDFKYRVEAQKVLPGLTGFSEEMIAQGLEELSSILQPEILNQKYQTELRGIPRDGSFHYDTASQRMMRWHPLGTIFHVLSGNVFLVGPGSMIEGLLTGNVTILKMSSAETVFMPLFLESLLAVEKELGLPPAVSASIAAIECQSSNQKALSVFKRNVDGIVVWGGEEAVQAYRTSVPARTRVIVFGPKLSVAVATKSALASRKGIEKCADLLASELCIWDQNACTAPQILFVESYQAAEALAAATAKALDKKKVEYPQGRIDPNQAAEIRKWRGVAEVGESLGRGKVYESSGDLCWTLILHKEIGEIETSPLHRTLRIYPYTSKNEVFSRIESMRSYIQTVGFFADNAEVINHSADYGEAGVLRLMPLGRMGGEDIDDPHDGAYDLPLLMNLVVSKLPEKDPHLRPFEFLKSSVSRRIVNDLFLNAVRQARKHPFFAERLNGVSVTDLNDLTKIPLTTVLEFENNILPQTDEIAWSGGYVTRSGGTTGKPKFSYFNQYEWNAMVNNAALIFRSCGFDQNDRVANFLFAGDLYGSFISFNDVNRTIGTTSFPFANVISAKAVGDIYRRFRFNVVQGFPAVILPLLREIADEDPDFRIEKVMYAGQPMSDEDRDWLKRRLGVKRIASVIGTTEAAQIAYQTEEDCGLVHTLIDDYNYIEIIGESGKPVADGEVGEIVVTSFYKQTCPVLRYRLGDRGRILPVVEKDHGRTARRMEYMGRSDDIIVLASMRLAAGDLKRAISGIKFSQLQLKVDNKTGTDRLTVLVEAEHFGAELQNKIQKEIIKNVYDMSALTADKTIILEVLTGKPGELIERGSVGKAKEIVDERYSS
ncbi:AMP-binding protein [Oligoflexaceae bacterium]|nr:AMP-binding protein [Oligoflexaceae bacterium]